MLRYNPTQNVYLFCSLSQGESNRFIKGYIYKSDGTLFLGGDGSTPLTHVSHGLYKSSLVFTMPVGMYKILFVPYLAADFSIPDNTYGSSEESLEIYSDAALDISGIADAVAALQSAVLQSDFEVELQDDDASLDVVVEDSNDFDVEIDEIQSDIEVGIEDEDSDLDVEVDDNLNIDVEIEE